MAPARPAPLAAPRALNCRDTDYQKQAKRYEKPIYLMP